MQHAFDLGAGHLDADAREKLIEDAHDEGVLAVDLLRRRLLRGRDSRVENAL